MTARDSQQYTEVTLYFNAGVRSTYIHNQYLMNNVIFQLTHHADSHLNILFKLNPMSDIKLEQNALTLKVSFVVDILLSNPQIKMISDFFENYSEVKFTGLKVKTKIAEFLQ